MKKRFLSAGLLASLITAAGMLPLSAQAVITTERVTITCGPFCASETRKYIDVLEQWNDLESMMRNAYAVRGQWDSFQNDPTVYIAVYESDLRCNLSAQAQATGIDSSSTLPLQKAAAERVLAVIKTSLGGDGTKWNAYIAGLPKSAGTTTNGAAYPATTPIFTVSWANGNQSSFTMTQGGSGWGVGQHTGWKLKPPGETTACPV